MRYFAPVETVNGEVLDVLFDWVLGGPEEPDHPYTWVIIIDAQSTIWILEYGGHVPFEIGETYTFEVRMWPCGGYSGPQVTQMTDVYPIEDYSPRITPAPGSPLPMILFIIIGFVMFAGPMLYRSWRNRPNFTRAHKSRPVP